MVEVGVRVDERRRVQTAGVEAGADLVGLVAGVDDEGVSGIRVSDDGAIAPEHADGKRLDMEVGGHVGTIARRAVKILPMPRSSSWLSAFLAVLVLLAGTGLAQDNPVKVKSAKIDGGDLVVEIAIDGGWHIYAASVGDTATRTRFTVTEGPGKLIGDAKEPPPKHKRQTFEGSDYVQEYDYHEGVVAFRIPFSATGSGKVKGRIDFTSCTDESCLPPSSAPWEVTVAGGASPPSSPRTRIERPESVTPRRGDDPLKIVAVTVPTTASVGESCIVEIEIDVDEGWHIYALDPKTEVATPTRFDVTPKSGGAVKVDKDAITAVPPPEDHAGEPSYSGHEGGVTFKVPFIPSSPGKTTWRFRMRYQTCDEKSCLPPASFSYDFDIDVAGNASPPPVVETQPANAVSTVPPTPRVEPPTPTSQPTKTATATLSTESVEPGSEATLTIVVDGTLPPGDVGAVVDAAFVAVVGKPTVVAADGATRVTLPVKVSPEAPEGAFALDGHLDAGGVRIDFRGSSKVFSTLLGFILLAIGSAAFALLTPCVFPMIPVTISYFTKQSGGKPIRLGLLYCFGIVASFTLIGFVFTTALGGQGATVFAQHWITQAFIGVLFVVFAASLFGGFEMQLPSWMTNLVGSAQSQGGTGGVLLMGALFSITTFTCTAAFVGTLLAQAATTGSWSRPLLGMIVFSSVLAAPFFFLSAFPSLVKSLPRSGGWMNQVKVVMGFVELVAATKFLNGGFPDLFPRTVCLVICVAAFVAMGLYLLGVFRLPHDGEPERTPVTGLFFAMTAFGTAMYLGTGLDGSPLNEFIDGYLPAVEAHKDPEHKRQELVAALRKSLGGVKTNEGAAETRFGIEARFKDDYEGAVAAAKAARVPLFIDFTGFTCQNCRTVEAVVFRNKAVRELLDKMVVVELHCDHPNEALAKKNLDLEERMVKAITQPYYVVVDPEDERQYGAWAFDLDIAAWTSKLEEALKRHAARTR